MTHLSPRGTIGDSYPLVRYRPSSRVSLPAVDQFNQVAHVYDSLMSVVPYASWVDYVEQLWDVHGLDPHRILDLACGTGSVAVELSRRGYQVEGVDISEAMLEVARMNLPRGCPVWQGDMRDFHLPCLPDRPFDACVSLFDSLNYLLSEDDLRLACARVAAHLAPGGSFVFDMNTTRALEDGMFTQSGAGRDASLRYDWHSAWDPIARLCTVRMEFRCREGGDVRVFHETHVQRAYTRGEIRRALEAAGFELLGVFDAFTLKAPTPRSDRWHWIARLASVEPPVVT